MSFYKQKKMTYFTSWEINVFLCLISVGLPPDLVEDWTMKFKKVHRELVLEEARNYYLDRKQWLPETGTEKQRKLLRDRQATWAYGYSKELNMRALRPIKTIPNNFWLLIQKVNWEYEKKLKDIEPEDRYEYFEWAFENHYETDFCQNNIEWGQRDLDWIKGFHQGRFFLMDHKRGVNMEEIRNIEIFGAIKEGRFILKQNHIEDLLNGKSLYSY